MLVTLGIDCGLTGAITLFRDGRFSTICDMPTRRLPGVNYVANRVDGAGVYDLIARFAADGERIQAFVENVRVMPAKSKTENSTQSQTSLVRTLGAIEATLDILGAVVHLVEPQSWQAFYGLVGKRQEFRDKGALPEAAQTAHRLYPAARPLLQRVKDHNRAESLLIAHYGLSKGG